MDEAEILAEDHAERWARGERRRVSQRRGSAVTCRCGSRAEARETRAAAKPVATTVHAAELTRLSQWQFELRTKFNEAFAQLSSVTIPGLQDAHSRENVGAIHDNVIASTTFAAWTEERRREIALADWDLGVIDEAHRASRTLDRSAGRSSINLRRNSRRGG